MKIWQAWCVVRWRKYMNENIKYNYEITILARVAVFAVFLTNLSQLPFFVTSGITQYISYPVWIVVFISCFLHTLLNKRVFLSSQIKTIMLLILSICILQLIFGLISGNAYFNSSLFQYLMFSFAIFLCGNVMGDSINQKNIEGIAYAFIISTFIVEINVYINFFASINAFSQKLFAYSSKNSVSLLIVTALILSCCFVHIKSKLYKIFNIAFIGSSLLILFLLKSRASIFGFLLAIIVFMFSKVTNPKIKKWFWIAALFSILLLIFNGNFYEIVVKNVFLANNEYGDLNAITSGRMNLFRSYPGLINGHLLEGIGPYYFECAPLSAILQFGIIIGSTYIAIMFYPFFSTAKSRKRNELMFLVFLISIVFCSNAFFEGLAPFGPGAKCFFLWFIWGIVLKQKNIE